MKTQIKNMLSSMLIALLFSFTAKAEEIAKYINVAPGGGISAVKTYTDWSKKQHTIIQAGDSSQLAFYNRIDNQLKIIKFDSTGAFTTQKIVALNTQYDQIVRGNFGGTARNDLFFYNRSAGLLDIYEINANGDLTLLHNQSIGTTWDILATGRWSYNNSPLMDPSGYFFYRTDLMTYNKTEGKSQFWKYSNGTLSAAKTYTGWQKSWDQIVSGNFDGNTTTDLLFFNQDGGNAKFYDFNESHNMTLIEEIDESHPDWPMAENVIIVPGRFGGGPETDLFLYDQIKHTGVFMADNNGALAKSIAHTNLQDKWVQIAAIDHSGSTTSDLLFYSNRYTIKIKAVQVADDDGSNQTPITTNQVNLWVETARKTFKPAGIDIEYDSTLTPLNNTLINNYNCNGELTSTKNLADQKAAEIASDSVVVYFRNAGGSGMGCGSIARKYVIMPGFNNTSTTYYKRDGTSFDRDGDLTTNDNIKLFPHELGHYFSLQHTYFSGNTSAPSLQVMDVDRGSGVMDTPPDPSGVGYDVNSDGDFNDPGEGFWDYFGYNRCDDTVAGEAPFWIGGQLYKLNPDRHNAMNNGCNCDLLYRFSPDQIRIIRSVLFNQRLYLIQ